MTAPGPDAAADGSVDPQRRPLTPRERDLLTRILGDILNGAEVRTGAGTRPAVPFLTEAPRVELAPARIRLDPPELAELAAIRAAIDPREG